MTEDLKTKKALILETAREIKVQQWTPAEIDQLRRRLMAEHGEAGKTGMEYIADVLKDAGQKVIINQQEEAEEQLEVPYKGEGLDIGFNITYLLDVLQNLSSERVRLAFGGIVQRDPRRAQPLERIATGSSCSASPRRTASSASTVSAQISASAGTKASPQEPTIRMAGLRSCRFVGRSGP